MRICQAASAPTIGVAARIIHVDARDTAAWSHDLREQTRAPARAPRVGTEDRASFVFVALQAVVQLTRWGGTVIWGGDLTQAGLGARLSVVDAVVVPDFRALLGQADGHVALQAGRFVKQALGGALLPGTGKVFRCNQKIAIDYEGGVSLV